MTTFFGLALIVVGVLMVIKTEWFYSITGALEWPEKHLGVGMTRLFLKIVGVVMVFFAFALLSGDLNGPAHAILTPGTSIPLQQ